MFQWVYAELSGVGGGRLDDDYYLWIPDLSSANNCQNRGSLLEVVEGVTRLDPQRESRG
jgi:hypothetical protein